MPLLMRVYVVSWCPQSEYEPFNAASGKPHHPVFWGDSGLRCIGDYRPTRPIRANNRNGYLLGSYRIATAPEPNSSRLINLKSRNFDSPANNMGPWPANLGCTTNSYSSINPSSAKASGSFTPPTNSPLPDSRLSCRTAFPRSPRMSSAFHSTRTRELDTTYFFAALIVRAKGPIQSGLAPGRVDGRNAASIIS